MFFTFFLLCMFLRHNMTAWDKTRLKITVSFTLHEDPPIDENRSICNEVV